MQDKVDSFGTSYALNKINEKNPIVFIHGVGLTKEIWEPQINFFKEYNTLTYDLLGHGKTPLKKSRVSFEDFSDQLFNLINELGFDKIHLVGFSLGALIARHFTSKHDNRLSSLIMHGSIYKRTEDQKRVVKNRFEIAKTNRSGSKHSAIRRWLSEDFIKKNPDVYKKIYSTLEKNNHKDFLKVIFTSLAHTIPQRCFPLFISTNSLPRIILLKFLDISGVDPTSFSPVVIRVLTLIFFNTLSSSM